MSIQAIAPVIESQLYRGVEYAVLLSIANHANADGIAWIGYQTMAEEARSTKRHVIRVVQSLIGSGAIRQVSEGGGPYGTNEYEIDIERFQAAADQARAQRRERFERRSQRSAEGGVLMSPRRAAEGVTFAASGGDSMESPPPVTPDVTHTVTPENKPARARAGETGRKRARAGGRGRKAAGAVSPIPSSQAEPPKITPPGGAEGELIVAALAGNDPRMAWKLEPWIGNFRVAILADGGKRIAIGGAEPAFRSVFTGALIHLGYPRGPIWLAAFAHKAIAKGRARWAPGACEMWFVPALRDLAAIETERL